MTSLVPKHTIARNLVYENCVSPSKTVRKVAYISIRNLRRSYVTQGEKLRILICVKQKIAKDERDVIFLIIEKCSKNMVVTII